ncbi:MAG TPA: proline--tRNA ligase, partial [Elusimicrobiota bacterium]|nr:proline--tRNA ligase [Elusimicrobiota bacterium]
MRLSRYLLPTLKELPSDADTPSARLMLRSGMIRKVASGLYEWLPFGLRALRNVERIVREEMDAAGGQEVWLPTLQPKELWMESGRWQAYGKEMMRLKDRKDGEFCLAPTAEEVITDLVRREVRSYRELPMLLYQFGEKFRDEIRPRFGVMRAREFYMKDAYSFHADEVDLEKTYRAVFAAYERVFTRCGLKFRPVEAQTGAIGGNFSHEFMVLAETGEETIAACDECGYAANVERAECLAPAADGETPRPMEEVDTPGLGAVADVAKFLNLPESKFLKTQVYVADDKPVIALLRGDTELNEAKLQKVLEARVLYRAGDDVYRSVAGCDVGYAGPQGRSVPVIVDLAAAAVVNGVSGANKNGRHVKNANAPRDYTAARVADLRLVRESDPCPRCGKRLSFFKGIEVGHTFKLGTKYSQAMGAGYLTEKGAKTPFQMGCYGIGVSRVVAAALEQCHDDNGIVWPEAIAPFDVAILPLNVSEPRLMETAERLEKELTARGFQVLLDDRDQRAGVKFKDADLLGLPWRVTVGEKKLAVGQVEIKRRGAADASDVAIETAAAWLADRRGRKTP